MIVRNCTSKQQENDNYMWKARDLRTVALSISNIPWSDKYVTVAFQELDYVGIVFASDNFNFDVHEVLRTRIEYLMLIMHKICEVWLAFFCPFYIQN